MKVNKKIALLCIFIFGLISPFIPTFTVFEMFFLLIPFGLIFIGTLIYLVISFTNKKLNSRNAIFAFSIIPTFILTQLFSGFAVDKIQRYRSQNVIAEINDIKEQTGDYPELHQIPLGIKLKKLSNKNGFQLEYSRGFMVTEKFDSRYNKWESYGWND